MALKLEPFVCHHWSSIGAHAVRAMGNSMNAVENSAARSQILTGSQISSGISGNLYLGQPVASPSISFPIRATAARRENAPPSALSGYLTPRPHPRAEYVTITITITIALLPLHTPPLIPAIDGLVLVWY